MKGAILKCKNPESREFWTGFLEQHSGVPWEPLIERGRDAFPGEKVVIPRFCKLKKRSDGKYEYEGIPTEAIDIAYAKDKKPEIIIRGWDGTGTAAMQARMRCESCGTRSVPMRTVWLRTATR